MENILLFVILVGFFYLAFKLGEKQGAKNMKEITGGKQVILSNGQKVWLTLDNKEKDIFECFMNLKLSKIELELEYEKIKQENMQ